MLIINADDWGRSRPETDLALTCFSAGRITSVSAMVFMEDSARAAAIANENRMDVGLHLNLSERFTVEVPSKSVSDSHNRIVRYLRLNRYAQLLYNPVLRDAFRVVFRAQLDEFLRLYAHHPSHVDGHQHMHLCANMLVDGIIPRGERVRRSFSFWPGEKSFVNRAFRRCVDRRLSHRYRVTDYFFGLSQNLRPERLVFVSRLARETNVELMTHPANRVEYDTLFSKDFEAAIGQSEVKTYGSL